MIFILYGGLAAEDKQNLVQVRFADLEIAMAGCICVDPDQAGFFQFTDMSCDGSVGKAQSQGQVVHAHPALIHQYL